MKGNFEKVVKRVFDECEYSIEALEKIETAVKLEEQFNEDVSFEVAVENIGIPKEDMDAYILKKELQ